MMSHHKKICTPKANLSEFMRHFNISYTGAFNRKYRRSGHLYQGRYKAFLIDADNYLLEISRYIHLNPLRMKSKEPQEKIDYVLDMVKNLSIIPAKFFKCIDSHNGIYEVRIKSGSNVYRIFCFFTEDKQVVLINCFQKKTQKTPANAIALACRLKEKYFEEKREKLK